MRVLGLDPGSRITGWGVIEGNSREARVHAFGDLRPPRIGSRATLLATLEERLEKLLVEVCPDVVVLETPFVARFPASTLALAEVRGAMLAVLGRWGGTVVEYEPARVKAAVVGHGRAGKQQVAFVLEHQLKLSSRLRPDTADALALALCHLRSGRLDA